MLRIIFAIYKFILYFFWNTFKFKWFKFFLFLIFFIYFFISFHFFISICA